MGSLLVKEARLEALLLAAPWRFLRGVAWHSHFSLHHRHGRATAVLGLKAHLTDGAVIQRLLASLTADALKLETEILSDSGTISASSLSQRGGEVRSANYQDILSAPWRNPITISEELVYRGLLLPNQKGDTYHIALELMGPLESLVLPPPKPSGAVIVAESASGEALRHDLLVLLLYCHQHSPKVLKGGRLPIAAVRELLPLLAVNDFVGETRNHPAVPRLWFLTQLALSANLVVAHDKWMPTPVASVWLGTSVAEQLSQLWQAWQPVQILEYSINRRPRQWCDWWALSDLRGLIQSKLAALPQGEWVLQEALLRGQTFVELTELGRLEQPDANETADANRGVFEELLPQLVALGLLDVAESGAVRLTELGQAFSQNNPPQIPARVPAPFERSDDHLLVPWPAPMAEVWRLAPFAIPVKGGTTLSFELTAKTVAAGMAKGYPLADLRRALAAGGLPFSLDLLPAQTAPHLRQAIWLEANSPAQMSELLSNRSVRLALRGGESVTPRHHTVDPRYINTLQKALTAMGQPAIVELNHQDKGSTVTRGPFHPNAWLLLAARLWQHQIAKGIEKYRTVTTPPPYMPIAIISALEAALTNQERAAIEQIWQETLDLLDPTVWDPDAVVAESDDGVRHLTPLQQAIDRAQPVQIEYEPAGKATSSRTIEPHYLEKRRDLWYLHAYCRKAQDKRQFRLDRIRSLSALQSK